MGQTVMDNMKFKDWISAIAGPSKSPTGNKIQNQFLIGSWILFAIAGMTIPENILRDHSWTRNFCDVMASFIPQIDRVTALDLKPDVNRFHYSLLWAISPLYFAIAIISGNKDVVRGHVRMSFGRMTGALLFCIYGIGFTMFLWVGVGFLPSDNTVTRVVFYYSLSRSIIAPVIVYAFWTFVGGIILIAKGIYIGTILKQSEGRSNG